LKDTPRPLTIDDDFGTADYEAGVVILIHKPAGLTSFGVVRRIRKLIEVKKVGHAGTLDPAATGLLIVLTGKATRRQQVFMGMDKEYLATIRLGLETTTWDLDGRIVDQKPVPDLQRNQLEILLREKFSGEIQQTPPAYSAIKQNGIPSYRRARKGKEIALKPRIVRVNYAEITDWSPPEFTLRLGCSSGFYVRSLAHDIGESLGCGAVLSRLIRTRIGPYHLENAVELDELAERLR
jgi:tRNA pseudouridine55 synthase